MTGCCVHPPDLTGAPSFGPYRPDFLAILSNLSGQVRMLRGSDARRLNGSKADGKFGWKADTPLIRFSRYGSDYTEVPTSRPIPAVAAIAAAPQKATRSVALRTGALPV